MTQENALPALPKLDYLNVPEQDDTDATQEDAALELSEELSSLGLDREMAESLGLLDDYNDDTYIEHDENPYGLDDDDDEDDDEFAGFDIDNVLAVAINAGASDVDIIANDEVSFEIRGDMVRASEFGLVSPEITTRLQLSIISHVLEQDFVENLELDTAYVIRTGEHKGRRLRLSVGKSFGEIFMVFRVISDQIPTPTDLGLPQVIQDWVNLPNGLVIFAGPTGSGKALRLDTLVLTPDGSVPLREIRVGDFVVDRSGQSVQVLAESEVNDRPELYCISLGDGQKIYADNNHEWVIKDEHKSSAVDKIEQVAKDLAHMNLSHHQILGILSSLQIPYVIHMEDLVAILHDEKKYSRGYEAFTKLAEWMKKDQEATLRTEQLKAAVHHIPVFKSRAVSPLSSSLAKNGKMELQEEYIEIVSIEKIAKSSPEYGPVKCLTVNSETSTFLCADYVVTHNSTSFASMINEININKAKKIVTIEKPIEYVYPLKKAVITQREIGKDARSFSNALKSAMRQHPKIIMVGEVRDREEVDEVLRAAETGHLALTTIHATSPPGVINRIMSLYEGEERLRILSSLKDNLRGIANQTLLKTVDGSSRFAVQAILNVTPEVSDMIGEGDVAGLQKYMQDNELTMEHQLVKAVRGGRCTIESAREQATLPAYFDELLRAS